jgi:hypothetical protein
MACGTITANFALSCDAPIQGGINGDVLYIANLEDWEAGTVTETSAGISAIALGNSGDFYKIEQPSSSAINATVDLEYLIGIPQYRHSITAMVASNSVDATNLIEKLSKGSYVAVLVTRDQQIMVFGADAGLKVSPATLKNYKENASAWQLELASEEGIREKKPPRHFIGAGTGFANALTLFKTYVAA